jgi:hypothetical protein
MANPLFYNGSQIWVDNGKVWGIEENRLAGLFSSSNAEFTTLPFAYPAQTSAGLGAGTAPALWVNAEARWPGGNGVGGADEGHAAYILAELQDASTGKVLPNYTRDGFVVLNDGGTKLPLVWKNATASPVAPGTVVQVKFYFREATIYAVGSN